MNCYLAYLDILGFKEIVNNNEIDKVYDLYYFFIKVLKQQAEVLLNVKSDELNIKFIFLSDSILFYSPDNSLKSFYDMGITTYLLLIDSIRKGFPLRGVITMGDLRVIGHSDLVLQSTTLLGKPIVEAYSLEKEFDWSGCVISETVSEFIKKNINQVDPWTKEITSQFIDTFVVKYGSIEEFVGKKA